MLKFGVVSGINHKKALAKVVFREEHGRDGGDKFEVWLPVMQTRTKKDRYFTMPDKGEAVACLMEDSWETGVILGAIYTKNNQPTSDMDADRAVIEFDDGTVIMYDRSASELTIDAVGSLNITIAGNADVDIQGVATIRATTGTINLLDSFTGSTKHIFI